MSPILESIGSVKGFGWGALAGGSFESISTVTVGGGGAASVEFTSIPATYTHLQIRSINQTNRASYTIDGFHIRLNSVTSANYSWHELISSGGNNDTPFGRGNSSATIMTGSPTISNVKPNFFGAAIVDILDYANTNKYKTIRTLSGADSNGDTLSYHTRMALGSGALYANTNAITSVLFFPENGTQFNQYTQFALYGIKGA